MACDICFRSTLIRLSANCAIIPAMRFYQFGMAFAATAIAWSAHAFPAVRLALPPVGCADTETMTNAAITAWERGMREFRFDLAFAGTPSNSVEMAFGTDSDGDGELSDGEIDVRVGWDCGALFIANNATDEMVVEDAAIDGHTFSCVFGIRSGGRIASVACTDNGREVFTGLASARPAWLYSPCWNMVRLTGRGESVRSGELFSVRTTPSGLIVRMR